MTDKALGRERKKTLVLSVLLHLLLFAAWEGVFRLDLIPAYRALPVKHREPIVFELQSPELPSRVLETPADAEIREKNVNPDFLSDKNARARNQQDNSQVLSGPDPYAEGDYSTHDLFPQPQRPKFPVDHQESIRQEELNEKVNPESADNQPDLDGLLPSPKKNESISSRILELPGHPGVSHRQLESRVEESGGLSFNTYDWNYAPYMLELKNKIQRNLFPPLAFSQLGIIDGNTLLRFKIYPDGRLVDLQILGYQGHRSLMETSANAVTVSNPFRRLPEDFPKEYLEVTARFLYLIKK